MDQICIFLQTHYIPPVMSIRKVARMGHPILREKAKKIDPKDISTPEIQGLIQDMIDTMEEYGGIGIAGPQVYEGKSIAIIRMESELDKYDASLHLKTSTQFKDSNGEPIAVFINPVIKVIDDKRQSFWEGCLSVPGLRGFVGRPRKVSVEYLDESGNAQKITVEDFAATVVQHELDHLMGKLYVDRIEDRTKLVFEEEYIKYHQSPDDQEVD